MSEDTKQETNPKEGIEENEVNESNPTGAPKPEVDSPEEAKPESDAEVESGEEAVESPQPVILSVEEHRKLTDQAEKSAEYWDRLLRLTAEFDNFKKRAARDRQEAIKYANESILEKLLPTLDNFDMAMLAVKNANAQADSLDSLKQGISMVFKQLKDVIKESGMEEIDAAGQTFNPAWHEAISQEETDEAPEGQVIKQLRKGYKLKDRLIRPANVIVAKATGQSEQPAEDNPKKTED
ncbi:MAG: Protein GrpE [Verrucomicrobia subdivision 3 bacterium]|nr:Protein GrpE [Limisphaerales bacterium]MCS1414975.1 Protein GrpE [Limisphaerales bacterium]